MREEQGVSEKTLRTYLKRLDGSGEETPWTLGGHRMSTPVELRADETDGRKIRIYVGYAPPGSAVAQQDPGRVSDQIDGHRL